MSQFRYVSFAGSPLRLQRFLSNLVPNRRSLTRLNRELDCPDLVVFASPETPLVRMAGDHGLIIGRLFDGPNDCMPLERLDRRRSALAASTVGRSLLEHSRGSYIAFIRAGPRIAVVRDPARDVPAFHAAMDGISICFSDLGLCSDLGFSERQASEECLQQRVTELFVANDAKH